MNQPCSDEGDVSAPFLNNFIEIETVFETRRPTRAFTGTVSITERSTWWHMSSSKLYSMSDSKRTARNLSTLNSLVNPERATERSLDQRNKTQLVNYRHKELKRRKKNQLCGLPYLFQDIHNFFREQFHRLRLPC